MRCPKCQFESPVGAKFCIECGSSLTTPSNATLQVLSFDEKLEKIKRYLPSGLTEKILSQKDKIEGERKQVTVMFCDMKGYTPLAEALGAEGAYSVMDQVYEILIHNVLEYEGMVNEMTGDGIMALFGAPIALEDAPQRALWSALSIHQEIDRFNNMERGISPIRMRIGIHTGPVILGTLGNNLRIEFKAVGDTVNLASRMEELAEPGTTNITKETYQLTKGLFQFEALGEKEVKGKEKPVTIYKVLSGKEDVYRPRLGTERMIYSEMVGRENELNKLELQVMKAINGEGSVVNIIGEAGIGKSRLVAELKKRDVMKRVNLLEGRAISIGRNLSFHPFIDVFKQLAQIREDDGEAVALGKLETAVRNVCSEDVYDIFPFIAILMGMKLSGKYAERVKGIEGEALEKLILKNVRELLIKATERTPQVIVAEDLHWADTSSIELLESLFRLAEMKRILFINVFRPGHKETGDRIVEYMKERHPEYYIEIVLEPLNERMSEALIHNMLNISGLHHAVIERIIGRAGGNPFFIEEVVRSFIDEGAVVLKEGTFEVTGKIRTMAIPHTINDLLMARIDRLDEDTRNLLKIAAVIGRNFFYRILLDVTITIEDIDGRLSNLKETQLIMERRRMDELEYLFKHALAQEATYESILLHKRKELHLQVAGSIEKVFEHRLHEFYGMLAYHYSKAENLDKAEEYLIKAGAEALRSSASNEALHYYQEALSIYLNKYGDDTDPDKIAMLDKNIAIALFNRGQYDEAVEYFDKALNYYWGKLPKQVILVLFKLLSAFFHFIMALYLPSLKFRRIPTKRNNEVVDLFYKKCKALGIINPRRFFIESLYVCKGITNFDLSKFGLGLEIFLASSALFSFTGISFIFSRKILDSARSKFREDDVRLSIIYEFLETMHNYLKGNWQAIKRYDDDLVNSNLSIGEIFFASSYIYWHGCSSIYMGSTNITKTIITRLSEIIQIYENDFSLLCKYLLKTKLLIESRKLNDALIVVQDLTDFAQKVGFTVSLIEIYSCEARIHILMRNIEEARKCLQHANEIRCNANAAPIQLSIFYRCQFEYFLYQLEESIKLRRKAESSKYRTEAFKSGKMLLKTTQNAAQHRIESYKLSGICYWLIDKQKKALKWWQKAVEEGERLDARFELSRTYFEIGKRLLESNSKFKKLNGVEAEEYLEKAKALFEKMDLQWDLAEMTRVTKR